MAYLLLNLCAVLVSARLVHLTKFTSFTSAHRRPSSSSKDFATSLTEQHLNIGNTPDGAPTTASQQYHQLPYFSSLPLGLNCSLKLSSNCSWSSFNNFLLFTACLPLNASTPVANVRRLQQFALCVHSHLPIVFSLQAILLDCSFFVALPLLPRLFLPAA